MNDNQRYPIVVLISGSGSNLQAVIDAAQQWLPIEIRAVICNRADAYGLQRAEAAGIATELLDHNAFPDRESYDLRLQRLIDQYQPRLVVLAGFMRILSDHFVDHYQGRMINIHPSLLPKYRGLHTHRRAIESGEQEHGATVHYVTPELDAGPIILQAKVPVLANDSEGQLAARVLEQEHIIYPKAIGWIAAGRVELRDGVVQIAD